MSLNSAAFTRGRRLTNEADAEASKTEAQQGSIRPAGPGYRARESRPVVLALSIALAFVAGIAVAGTKTVRVGSVESGTASWEIDTIKRHGL